MKTELEEAAEKLFIEQKLNTYTPYNFKDAFTEGAKWQMERSYSEEEVKQILLKSIGQRILLDDIGIPDWFEQFKKK